MNFLELFYISIQNGNLAPMKSAIAFINIAMFLSHASAILHSSRSYVIVTILFYT